MKICLSFIIRQTINKITVRYHYIPIKWLKSKRLTIPTIDKYVEQSELSYIISEKTHWKTVGISFKIMHNLTKYTEIPFLGVYSRDMETLVYTYTQKQIYSL